MEKPKRKRRRDLPRIFVEWICGRCHRIHRISFFCSVRPVWHGKKGIRAKWGDAHRRFKLSNVEIEYETSLSELNEFLNSLFSQSFNAEEYVKIYYPKKLLTFLIENEQKRQLLLAK